MSSLGARLPEYSKQDDDEATVLRAWNTHADEQTRTHFLDDHEETVLRAGAGIARTDHTTTAGLDDMLARDSASFGHAECRLKPVQAPLRCRKGLFERQDRRRAVAGQPLCLAQPAQSLGPGNGLLIKRIGVGACGGAKMLFTLVVLARRPSRAGQRPRRI